MQDDNPKHTVLVNAKFPFRPRKMAVLHDDDALRSHAIQRFRSRTVPRCHSVLIARSSALFPPLPRVKKKLTEFNYCLVVAKKSQSLEQPLWKGKNTRKASEKL